MVEPNSLNITAKLDEQGKIIGKLNQEKSNVIFYGNRDLEGENGENLETSVFDLCKNFLSVEINS